MRTKIITGCLLFCFILPGCEDIFVKDISDDLVYVISPVDSALCTGEKILFVWEKMKGAEHYQIVVVSPSFDKISTTSDIVADTIRAELSLPEGKYQWSIYAYNSEYKSRKTIRSFEITTDEE